MSGSVPVLATIKSEWGAIEESPVIGKDVLELLSSSMYVNPLAIYREYIQNSVDAIEEATGLGLLSGPNESRIEIQLDSDSRVVRIRDNGTGVPKEIFTRTLIALGASRKRGLKARGFRGVGRLAGLGYCRELIFRSRAEGEVQINEMRWDCQRLKKILRDAQFTSEISDLIKNVVRTRRFVDSNYPVRFFEVELIGIVRHGSDALLSNSVIADYLAQVAPVPFSPAFKFGKHIESSITAKVRCGNVRIYIDGSPEPIYRPHRNSFDVRKGLTDRFEDPEFFDIMADDGRLAATGWVLHHSYRGAIDRAASIKGLRLRSGNMQVGEANLLDAQFAEPRFNSWVVGEIHVLDERILPNGRRDDFEQSVHLNDLLGQLEIRTQELSRRCRSSSVKRNLVRQFDFSCDRISSALAIMRQGAIDRDQHSRNFDGAVEQLDKLEWIAGHPAFDEAEQQLMNIKINRLRRRITQMEHATATHRRLSNLTRKERELCQHLFTLIYQCSANSASAKSLVDKLLRRLNRD